MRLALAIVLCFAVVALGAWFAITKIALGKEEAALVSPLTTSAMVLSTENILQPSPSPNTPELIMYRVPITKVSETTITVKGKEGELTLVKKDLWVSKMRNNIVSNAGPDLLQAGQRVDLQSINGKTTVLVLL